MRLPVSFPASGSEGSGDLKGGPLINGSPRAKKTGRLISNDKDPQESWEKVKDPGPRDVALPLPPGRGLHKILCLSKVLWSIGVLE